MKKNSETLFNKIKKIASHDLSLINILRLFNIFIKSSKEECFKCVKIFVKEYYFLEKDMPDDFYNLILNKIYSEEYIYLFNEFIKKDIYSLISYLKYNQEKILGLKETITPIQYYIIPKKYINKIIEKLKKLEHNNKESKLNQLLKDEYLWVLKREPNFNEDEYINIAYKIYLSIGLDNSLELLDNKYGEIDYTKIHFLFSKLNVKDINDLENQILVNFLFNNKKDFNNSIRQMLNGSFMELFLNFDYFCNNFKYFIYRLGTKMSKSKLKSLLEERYLPHDISIPEITGDILEDMISSYYNKYDFLNVEESEIYKKNYKIYNEFLRKKYKSSIPMIEIESKDSIFCEVIRLSDPRNLVLGYRSGNCFRINGDAHVLFHNFLQSEHMRLLSISSLENKDFAMMLIMRNGNVLIGQGIEISKRNCLNISRKKIYDACRETLKQMMEYMNSMGDEIVATIIGSSNSNVSEYNNQVLPFLINPILENQKSYYNGVYNYQCLLDLSEGKSLKDIKLYIPSIKYFDKREPILRRTRYI